MMEKLGDSKKTSRVVKGHNFQTNRVIICLTIADETYLNGVLLYYSYVKKTRKFIS